MMYNGRQETNVMANTFHRNSYDQMKSQSEKELNKRQSGSAGSADCDALTEIIVQNHKRQ